VKSMPSVSQQRNIPEVIRALSGMERPDYIDLFTVTTNQAAEASPEQWCRPRWKCGGSGRPIHLARRPRSAAEVAAFDGAGGRIEDRRSR
jgi:hypothetical protein